MMLIRTFVAPSRIHGAGVFTVAPVAKGAAIWRRNEILDNRLIVAAVRTLPPAAQDYIEFYAYPAPDDPENTLILDGDDGRFMNHSRDPNATFAAPEGVALRDIAAGEEITCDYREFYTDALLTTFAFL